MDRIFVMGWLMALNKLVSLLTFAFLYAIPFHYAWNAVIPVYFGQYIPLQFHAVTYFHFVCIILLINFIGQSISKLVPTLISIKKESE